MSWVLSTLHVYTIYFLFFLSKVYYNLYSLTLFFYFLNFSRKLMILEHGTLELDTLNSDRLISISNVDTFNFLLNLLFSLILNIPTTFRPMIVISLNGAQNFKFPGFWLAVRDSAYAILLVKSYTQTQDTNKRLN